MSLRTDASSASALVYSQYALYGYATELSLALVQLHRLRRSTNHPSAALDPVIARISRIRDEVRDEINGIEDLLDPQTPSEKYPAAPASSPDGPTLFDEAGNASDPIEVLALPNAVPYAPGVPLAASGSNGDAGVTHAVASPQRKRKGR
jgi:hypothetical protein